MRVCFSRFRLDYLWIHGSAHSKEAPSSARDHWHHGIRSNCSRLIEMILYRSREQTHRWCVSWAIHYSDGESFGNFTPYHALVHSVCRAYLWSYRHRHCLCTCTQSTMNETQNDFHDEMSYDIVMPRWWCAKRCFRFSFCSSFLLLSNGLGARHRYRNYFVCHFCVMPPLFSNEPYFRSSPQMFSRRVCAEREREHCSTHGCCRCRHLLLIQMPPMLLHL